MTKCTGVPLLSLGHDGEITLWGVAFVNPKGRTLARSSYPTLICDRLPRNEFAWELVANLVSRYAGSGKSCRSCGRACRRPCRVGPGNLTPSLSQIRT